MSEIPPWMLARMKWAAEEVSKTLPEGVTVSWMMDCEQCELPFDPIGCRWRCPSCGHKMSCCEGADQGGEVLRLPPAPDDGVFYG